MAKSLDELLADEVLSQTISLFRLSAGKRREVLAIIAKMQAALVKKLQTESLTLSQKREIAAFFKQAGEIVDQAYAGVQGTLDLGEVGKTSSDMIAASMKAALGAEAVAIPSAAYFKALSSNIIVEGVPQATWWNRQAEYTKLKFEQQVRQGLASAETNQQIVSRIVGKNGSPGIMDTTRRDAMSLVNTSVQAVANEGRLETFRANPDLIKAIKQVSTLDSHTSKVCIAYSGARWTLDGEPLKSESGQMSPAFNGGCPRHFNCRSCIVPETKSFRELGIDIDELPPSTRASDEGQIAASTSFDDFLKRKGKAYQDEQLGAGRADLWRSGKITLRDLVSGDGKPLTLDELRRKAGLD